jgi:methionyl-tRNA formyltransferase
MHERLKSRTGHDFYLIEGKDQLNAEALARINPRMIFFPHWSHIIPKDIYKNYECVIFHMTDVPYGRGGSPLQNLISRGIYETKISAIRCEAGLDSGPVYLKKPLSLYGSAEEIFIRASKIIEEMIAEIIDHPMEPKQQEGEAVYFKRRKPEEGNLIYLDDLEKVHDYIRMLDAEGYPRAFIETEHLRFEFERASLKRDCIRADVIITKKNRGERGEYHHE